MAEARHADVSIRPTITARHSRKLWLEDRVLPRQGEQLVWLKGPQLPVDLHFQGAWMEDVYIIYLQTTEASLLPVVNSDGFLHSCSNGSAIKISSLLVLCNV